MINKNELVDMVSRDLGIHEDIDEDVKSLTLENVERFSDSGRGYEGQIRARTYDLLGSLYLDSRKDILPDVKKDITQKFIEEFFNGYSDALDNVKSDFDVFGLVHDMTNDFRFLYPRAKEVGFESETLDKYECIIMRYKERIDTKLGKSYFNHAVIIRFSQDDVCERFNALIQEYASVPTNPQKGV